MADSIPKEIDRDGIRLLQRRGAQLVDVCTRDEFELIHLPGAISIPLTMISRHTANRIDWNTPVIVYSQGPFDDRSARSAWRLTSMGFTQVFRYIGGRADWLANGLPAEGSQGKQETVADLANLDVPTCGPKELVREVKGRVTPAGWKWCPVVTDQLVVLGLLRPSDLEKADPNWPAEDTMDRDPPTLRLDIKPGEALNLMESKRLEVLLITFPDGKLFGLLSREELQANRR